MAAIETVENPVWDNQGHTAILCTVTINNQAHPFRATISDPEEHGRQLWDALVAGEHGAIGDYVAPPAPVIPKSTNKTVMGVIDP